MKRTFLLLLAALAALPAAADEGMWLPSLIGSRIDDMHRKGFRLPAEAIYDADRASMKDAVVLFDGGCTGEIVSQEGLLLTNHHCGYDAIHAHSTVENDLLTAGFWARSREEELPCEGLNVRILVGMEEVTDRVAAGTRQEDLVREAEARGKGYRAAVEPMYAGNQWFLFVYEQFDDVRLVGAPPSSIGKFGGDTDNWMWPRHTGDFSVFRIYAGRDNRPAAYAPDNVPYRPKRHFAISTDGIREGDFTMIYGFPGNTQTYILSYAVDYIARRSDPAKIAVRTGRLEILAAAAAADPALRIHYAAQHASVANAWKKWQGEKAGIDRLGTAAEKRAYEEAFDMWAADRAEFAGLVAAMRQEYARIADAYFAREITRETLETLPTSFSPEERTQPFFESRRPTERALYRHAFREYARRCPAPYAAPAFTEGVAEAESAEAYADQLFDAAWRGDDTAALGRLTRDVKRMQRHIAWWLGTTRLRNLSSGRLEALYTRYLRGLRAWDEDRAFYPDANLTLRVAYGAVAGYENADGEWHKPFTTLDGIIAKDNPAIYDYDVPDRLRELHRTRDYGRWATRIDSRTTVPVCFLATNHTSGGNSGSPVLDARGRLVGINFDRTWRTTMSDIAFDPAVCRNIAVDIRYVLFTIERVGGAGYLLDEMTLR